MAPPLACPRRWLIPQAAWFSAPGGWTASAGIETLLQVRLYIRGELEDHMQTVAPILVEFLAGSRPAVTGIGVASLASKATLVEIEAVARIKG